MIKTVILVGVFLCVVSEKCKRRLCQLNFSEYVGYRREIKYAITPSYCTHLILYCARVSDKQEIYLSAHSWTREEQQALELMRRNPDLIVILAVQNKNFTDFVKMYTTGKYKKKFIRNIIKFARDRKIDGIKIDVQPEEGGDKEKFTLLLKDLSAAFAEEAYRKKRIRLLLSVGIPSDKSFLDKYYEVQAISNYVDMVDLATYSFVFVPEGSTVVNPTHHSPLYSKDTSSTKTIDFMCRYIAGKGVGKDKINVGLAFVNSMYVGDSQTGIYIFTEMRSGYSLYCGLRELYEHHTRLEPEKGQVSGFDNVITFYDSPENIREKVKYIKANHFGGVLMYTVDSDDTSDCKQGKHPLARSVYEECSTKKS